ncbi:MAG: fibronectin type III domain-containing protein [Bacteroidales bacterium]|nr:fibronectin type III domain-containing protein [Bacteroidales bacterium]
MKKTLTFAVRFGVLLCSFCLLSHATYGNHPTLYTPCAPLTVRSATSCPSVTNLNVSEVTETTARVTWEPGGSETQWLYIVVMSDSTSPSASDPGWQIITNDTLQLDSLSEGHFYRIWVKADCGNGLISNASHVDLWTDCQDLSSFPYVENFNNPEPGYYHVMPSVGPLPHCWVERDHAVHLGSDGILRFHTFQNQLKIAILPRLADNVPITHLKMTFSYRNPYNDAPSTLFIGVMDDPFDISTFVPLDSATTPYDNWGWHQKEVLFENYSGSGRYIAMKYIPSSVNYFDVDNLALDMVYNCHDPYNVMATSISPGTAYITWDDEEGEDEWEVAIVPDYQTEPDSSQIVTVHQSEYHATNINDTNLVFFVRTHCSNGWDYSEWVSIPVTSFAYQPATVPYSHDFENGNENAAWRMETGNPVSRWQIGIPNGYSDSLLFVTNNGTDASYGSTIAEAWAYRDFQLSGATEYEIRFRWLCNGHSSYAYMHAMVGEPAPILVSTNYFDDVYPEGSVLIGKFALQDDWKTTRYVLGSENDNTVRRLYFRWRNVYNSVYPPGAVIDNVQIVPYHCPRPVDVTFEGATAHDAFISFSSAGIEQVAWQYVMGVGDIDPDTVSDVVAIQGTSIQLSGLQSSTNYTLYVRSVCDNGYYSAWSDGVAFQTLCDPLSLPYYEDFTPGDNHSGNLPDCWSSLAPETGIHSPYISENSMLDDGGSVLRFAGNNTTDALVILPEVLSDYSVNNLRLSFLMRTGSGYPSLIVGVMSDPDDISTFVPVDTVQTVESQAVNRMDIFFDHYQGSGTYIALISDYAGEYDFLIDLDDLVLEEAPLCHAPSDLRATNVSQHSATLWWTPANDEQAWEIAYGTEDFNPDSANNICVANVNPFVLTGLDEGTFYGCYVRALCSSGEYSEWSPLGYIFTRCAPMSVVSGPYQESFDSYTTEVSTSYFPPMNYPYITYPDCWTFLNLHVFVGCPPGVLPVAFLSNSSNLIVLGNSLHLVDSRVTPLYAVLPEFAEHLRFLKLTFSYKYATIRPTLSVGYMTDPSDGNTYHEVQSCPYSNTNSFTTMTIDYSTLGLAADSNYCIAFRTYDSVTGWTNAAIENVKVQLIPNAFPAPTQLVVNDITSHTATVDWTDGNGESHWVVQYRLATSPDWTDSMDVYSHPVFLDSLTSNTVYDVRVKSVYGDSRTMCSDYTTTDFTTLDDTSVPDYDDFGQHVSIRPNPAKQFIDIDLDEAIAAGEILLYNAYGQWIKTIPVQNLSTRIGLEELSAGVYVVRVVGESGVATKRFVKE